MTPCLICDAEPIELRAWSDPVPIYRPGCEHAPRCPACRHPINEGRCANMDCVCWGALIPEPTYPR